MTHPVLIAFGGNVVLVMAPLSYAVIAFLLEIKHTNFYIKLIKLILMKH